VELGRGFAGNIACVRYDETNQECEGGISVNQGSWHERLSKLSVKWKIFMLSAAVFGLSLTVGFAYFTYQSYWLNVTTALNGLMNFTDAKQQGVIRFIDQNEKLARQLANLVEQAEPKVVRSQLSNIVSTDVFDVAEHPFKDEITSGVRKIPTFKVYHAIDYVERGVVRLSSDPLREGKRWDRYVDVKVGYSDPWYDGDKLMLTFAAQTRKGTLYVHADGLMLTNIVSGEIGNLAGDMGAYYLAGVGKTFDYYLVNKDNLIITVPRANPERLMRGTGSETPWRTTLQQAGVMCGKNGVYLTNARCTTGCRETMGEYVGFSGKQMLGASMPFYDSNWTLVVEQEKYELLLPMWVMFLEQMAMLIVLGALSIYLYLRLQDKAIIHPLVRLQEAIEEVEKTQDFSKPIQLDSRDEFGILANAFNRMSHNLDSVYRHLEQRVTERTEELQVLNEQIRGNLRISQEMQQKLAKSEQETKQALTELELQKLALDKHAIVSITDITGTITYANDLFCKISQYGREELLGKNHRILNSGYHSTQFFREMYRSIARGVVWHNEVCNRAKDGSLYWLDMTVVPFMDDNGKPYQYIAIRTDITARKRSEQEAEHLAYFDPLTSLPNRRLLQDRLHQSLATNVRNGRHGAVLFIDLDNFKNLNDTRGHAVGDQLLIEVAHRLKGCVRDEDTVARLGGDEFVVLLENLSSSHEEAANHSERVARKVLQDLNRVYLLGEHEHYSSPSIGIALYCQATVTVDEIIKQADGAMYQSKKAGRNTVRFYDPTTQEALTARNQLESALHHAIQREQLALHYQVQVDEDYHPFGAEVLLRWMHPEMGNVPPDQFIPLAEGSGLIVPIGDWVLDAACKALQAWQDDPLVRDLTLSVNVSLRQMRESNFLNKLQQVLLKYHIQQGRLKLEITESMVSEDVETLIVLMHQIRSLGVAFSMDDFGTGYSSLSSIKRLPLSQLKIDQSFVRDIVHDKNDKAIVSTIIAMADSMGLKLIAEGVETEEQRHLLAVKGCTNYQGYLFSKPLPLEAFLIFLRKNAGGG